MTEYKIKVDGNRVIFDGHAEDVETCNAITRICNALCDKEKVIKFDNGYAEFEVGNGELKFMAIPDDGSESGSNNPSGIEKRYLDKAGLTHFAKILSNYPDNTILSAVINAISDMITETSESDRKYIDSKIVQNDWNQNDETALDYIKNRPFYINGTNLEMIVFTEAQKQKFRESIGAIDADHVHSASTVTTGTFAGMVIAQSSGQATSEMCLRNSKLVSSETNPSNNGEICWLYE